MWRRIGEIFLILIFIQGTSLAEDVQVEALVNSEEIGLNDTLIYTLNISCGFNTEPSQIKFPDFQGFRKLSQSESTKMNIVIGGSQTFSKVKSYNIELLPNRTGMIEIKPAIVVVRGRVYQSQPIKVTVLPASRSVQQKRQQNKGYNIFKSPFDIDELPFDGHISDEDVMLQAVVDRKTVYVGEQFVFSLYLYSAIGVYDIEQLDLPKFEGAWVEDLYNPQRLASEGQKRIGSKVYNVYLLKRRAVFPTKAGIYEIEPSSIVLNVVAGFSQKRMTRQTQSIKIDVRPLPEKDMPQDFPVYNVGDYRVSFSLTPQRQPMDKPFTLNVVVEGKGNINAFTIPKLRDNPELRFYDPVIRTEQSPDRKFYGGRKSFEYLIFARRTGRINIPSFDIVFFKPDTSTYEKVLVGGLTVDVTDAEGATGGVKKSSYSHDSANISSIRFVNRVGDKFNGLSIKTFVISITLVPSIFILIVLVDFGRFLYLYLGFDSEISKRRRRLKKSISIVEKGYKEGNIKLFIENIYFAIEDILYMKAGVIQKGMTRDSLRESLISKGIKEDIVSEILMLLDAFDFIKFAGFESRGFDITDLKNRFDRVVRELGE
jgi:hypothetical protein